MRLEPELKARLQERADREHRSLTNLVDLLLRQAVGLLPGSEKPERPAKRTTRKKL